MSSLTNWILSAAFFFLGWLHAGIGAFCVHHDVKGFGAYGWVLAVVFTIAAIVFCVSGCDARDEERKKEGRE